MGLFPHKLTILIGEHIGNIIERRRGGRLQTSRQRIDHRITTCREAMPVRRSTRHDPIDSATQVSSTDACSEESGYRVSLSIHNLVVFVNQEAPVVGRQGFRVVDDAVKRRRVHCLHVFWQFSKVRIRPLCAQFVVALDAFDKRLRILDAHIDTQFFDGVPLVCAPDPRSPPPSIVP